MDVVNLRGVYQDKKKAMELAKKIIEENTEDTDGEIVCEGDQLCEGSYVFIRETELDCESRGKSVPELKALENTFTRVVDSDF